MVEPDSRARPDPGRGHEARAAHSSPLQAVELDGKSVPPIASAVDNGTTQCDPQTPCGPADTAIDPRVDDQSVRPLSLSSVDLFAPGRLVRFEGALGHAASELGFTVNPHAESRIVIRTPRADECAADGK